jgi:hypothetical protein
MRSLPILRAIPEMIMKTVEKTRKNRISGGADKSAGARELKKLICNSPT